MMDFSRVIPDAIISKLWEENAALRERVEELLVLLEMAHKELEACQSECPAVAMYPSHLRTRIETALAAGNPSQ